MATTTGRDMVRDEVSGVEAFPTGGAAAPFARERGRHVWPDGSIVLYVRDSFAHADGGSSFDERRGDGSATGTTAADGSSTRTSVWHLGGGFTHTTSERVDAAGHGARRSVLTDASGGAVLDVTEPVVVA